MSLPLRSQQEYYTLFINALQAAAADLTDTLDGSDIDIKAGTFSVAAIEVQKYIVDQFNKTFFDLAGGPEVTGGPDDLQTLAVDHFGNNFARPGAIAAIDVATFSRPGGSPATYGAVTILAGSIVKTEPDPNGNAQRYATNADVTLTHISAPSDTSVSVGITAVVAGVAGDAVAGAIDVIETSLLDPTIVVTNAGNITGEDAQDDSTYRETIRNLIEALAGATSMAIEAKAKTVPGVVTATAIETAITAIQYNIANNTTIGAYFRVPIPILYIADSTGSASSALIQAVLAAIKTVRACGVFIQVKAATAVVINWTGHIILNPFGPNYSTLVNDPSQIIGSMEDYINNLPVGTNFIRTTANAAIMAIWGPSGTNDLTSFTTSIPSGDVAVTATQKPKAGTVGLA